MIRCCCSLKKSNFERIPLIALYKRAAMSKSLLSLFKKDQCQWFTRESLFHSKKKERFARKKSYFSPCFLQFFTVVPLSMLKSDSLPSLFIPLLFFKELLWANRSCLSLQKSDCEWFAHIALYKRATGVMRSFPRGNHYFALSLTKKIVICLKNQRANSQPWNYVPISLQYSETYSRWERCREDQYSRWEGTYSYIPTGKLL